MQRYAALLRVREKKIENRAHQKNQRMATQECERKFGKDCNIRFKQLINFECKIVFKQQTQEKQT